jgi:hypothetical protein
MTNAENCSHIFRLVFEDECRGSTFEYVKTIFF